MGAWTVVAGLVGLVLLGVIGGAARFAPGGGPPANDRTLYLRVIDEVHRGEGYYPAAVRDQRQGGYPLRPSVTVRLPTLAVAMAALSDGGARRLSIECLAVATVLAWAWRLRRLMDRPISFSAAIFLLGASTVPAFVSYGYTLHELWSGELIALSLALYRRQRWFVSFAIGLAAVSVRELAVPYLAVMAVLAWREDRRGEALAWVLGGVACLAALAIHTALVRALVRPDDVISPGWLALGGWKFLLTALKWNGVLFTAPDWAPALLAPLALLGLLADRGPLADRLAFIVLGYGGAFMIFGRPDNAYWGMMIAPLWPLGLIGAGPALRELALKIAPALQSRDAVR
jgi:hypothetical protein